MILGQNPDSVLGPLSSKPPGLQQICMILGLIQIQLWDPYPPDHLVYPCLQFICMILGLNLDSIFGFGSSKPPGLQRICMILGLNLDSIRGS